MLTVIVVAMVSGQRLFGLIRSTWGPTTTLCNLTYQMILGWEAWEFVWTSVFNLVGFNF